MPSKSWLEVEHSLSKNSRDKKMIYTRCWWDASADADSMDLKLRNEQKKPAKIYTYKQIIE